jgi:hypothetical protein
MTSELTAGEKAYLESGGTDTAGLLAENPTPAAGTTEAPVVHKIEPDKPAPVAAEKAAEPIAAPVEPPEPGEEEIPAADGKTKRRMVDSRALKAEREKARGLEAELQKERDTRARVDERLKMLSEAVTAAEPTAEKVEAPVIPDPEQDIFGYAKYLAAELETLKRSQTQAQTETAEQRQTAAVVNTYQRDAATFRVKQPDFNDAYNFLIGVRKQQLEAQRYSPEDVQKWLYTEEMNLVQRAIEGKSSPSQDIYNLAKSMGYAPKAAPTAIPAIPAAAAAPAAAMPQAAPAAPLTAPSVTEEIDRIKAGKAASMSLSNGGGGGAEEMSLEWLANAPAKEFAAFMDKPGNREKVERALGKKAA